MVLRNVPFVNIIITSLLHYAYGKIKEKTSFDNTLHLSYDKFNLIAILEKWIKKLN